MMVCNFVCCSEIAGLLEHRERVGCEIIRLKSGSSSRDAGEPGGTVDARGKRCKAILGSPRFRCLMESREWLQLVGIASTSTTRSCNYRINGGIYSMFHRRSCRHPRCHYLFDLASLKHQCSWRSHLLSRFFSPSRTPLLLFWLIVVFLCKILQPKRFLTLLDRAPMYRCMSIYFRCHSLEHLMIHDLSLADSPLHIAEFTIISVS